MFTTGSYTAVICFLVHAVAYFKQTRCSRRGVRTMRWPDARVITPETSQTLWWIRHFPELSSKWRLNYNCVACLKTETVFVSRIWDRKWFTAVGKVGTHRFTVCHRCRWHPKLFNYRVCGSNFKLSKFND